MRLSFLPRTLLRPLLHHPLTLLTSPPFITLLLFLLLYTYLLHHCRTTYFADPTSFFFDPDRGYQRHYSVARQRQSDAFIDANSAGSSSTSNGRTSASKPPRLCVGIATVARDNEQYVRSTVGSLLEGLDTTEREEIYMAVLIAHTAPASHPVHRENWLAAVVDKVLLYDFSSSAPSTPLEGEETGRNDTATTTERRRRGEEQAAAVTKEDVVRWETERDFVRKAIFDYTYVMQKCADTGAEWVAMVEDDTIAVQGWYGRVMAALERADDRHRATTKSSTATTTSGSGSSDWLYLRMFFTEEFLGWNVEEWPTYLIASAAVVAASLLLMWTMRKISLFKPVLTDAFVGVVAFGCVPALIVLYFLAGRQSMQPMVKSGVSEMPRFGCCAQGLVFSAGMTPKVIAHLREKGQGFVDQLIEAWANENGFVRWVVAPSLLQHVGAHSSKGDDMGEAAKWDRSVAEKIWNFGFERYDERIF